MDPRYRRSLSLSLKAVSSFTTVLSASLLLLLATAPEISCLSNKTLSSDSSYSSSSLAPSPAKTDRGLSADSAESGRSGSYRDGEERAEDGELHAGSNRTRARGPSCSDRSCTSQGNIHCHIIKRSEYCMHREESALDHPNSPRDLKISHTQVGDQTYFNITWKAPHDYSYRAVRGYELLVTYFDFSSLHGTSCFFVNLTSTNWKVVTNIHDVVFFWTVGTFRPRGFGKQ